MPANTKQIGGEHYRSEIQHWDYVLANNLDYFQGQITKYVSRWKNKNGIEDLKKAQHFLEKYIEEVSKPICTCGAMEDPTAFMHIPGCDIQKERDKHSEMQRELNFDTGEPTSAYTNQA